MTPEEKSSQTARRLLPLLKEGQIIEIHPQGSSMFPLLIEHRDSVLIQSLENITPKRGDILLYQRKSGLLVLHRLHHIKNNGFYFVGDNQTELEGPLDSSQLLAKVTHIRRKGHLFSVRHPLYLLFSRIWLFLRPIRPYISRPIGKLWRLMKHFFDR